MVDHHGVTRKNSGAADERDWKGVTVQLLARGLTATVRFDA
jgi:hypothetical protein